MSKRIFAILLVLISAISLSIGQVVVTTPTQPNDADLTTITFDATKGDAGLKNYNTVSTSLPVYAHIGVITDKSTGDSDWKYVKAGWSTNLPACKMIQDAVNPNLYTLQLASNIRAYFGVPVGEAILKIAIVFRSADGTKTGKDTGGKDIFTRVYPSTLFVDMTVPTGTFFIHKQGTALNVTVEAFFNTTIQLLDNGVEITSTSGQSLTHSYTPTVGSHKLLTVAVDGSGNEVKDSTTFLVDDMITPVVPMPSGLRQGANYISNTEATLVLFAPYKSSVYVLGDFNNWQPTSDYKMNKGTGADTAMYWISIPNLTQGAEYGYQYLIDNKIKIADPYTNKILDPWDDKYIADIVYPDLKAYPAGKTTDRVSVLQTGQTPYNWQVTDFVAPDSKSLVVYELLIRDFQNSMVGPDKQLGYLQQCIDSIDYFKRLGINAIEIMPFNEFEGNISWGYNPNFYFAPDKAYGTAEKYKEFIDLCHQNGIAVIMDMVLNHAFNSCAFAKMYWNDALGRPAANNPWFNQTAPHTCFSWGSDFNHQSVYTKALVDSINSYWMSEYKIDGFRFDFTKGFTNTASTCTVNNGGSTKDDARIILLKRMYDEIKLRNPDAYVILEHLTDNSEEKILADYGMMLWGNSVYNYNQNTLGSTSQIDITSSSYKARGFVQPNLVAYMESHDEERQMYKNKKFGLSNATYSCKTLSNAVRRSASATAIYMGIPGPKMVWMFGERGYDVSIDSIGRTDPKPPKWEYMQNADRLYLFNTYSKLIKLKTTEPVFETTDYTLTGTAQLKQLSLNYSGSDVRIVTNFKMVADVIQPLFSKTGIWYDHFNGKTIDVTDVNMTVLLNPGEFALYSEKELTGYVATSLADELFDKASLEIYPMPFTNELTLESNTSISFVKIYSVTGQLMISTVEDNNYVSINTSMLPKGVFIAKVTLLDGSTLVRQIIK